MSFASRRNISNAFELSPRVRVRVVGPYIVEPRDTISTAKSVSSLVSCHASFASRLYSQVKPVTPCDHGVISTRGRDLAVRWPAVNCVLDQNLPSVTRLLQSVQIERNKVVEEVAFDLTTENVELASKNIQGVSVASRGARTCRQRARPLFGCCRIVSHSWMETRAPAKSHMY